MTYDAGEEYDCDACGGIHVVETGKGLRVAGSSEGLDPTPYVRCPEAGVIRLADDGRDAPAGRPGDPDAADGGDGDDSGASDWP